MTAIEILKELERFGDSTTKNTFMRHGAVEPFFGVKIADLKKILKKTKKNHELSLELFASGNSDAMYLAGLMADETKISKEDLNKWVSNAYWSYLSEYSVPWVAAETTFGFELGLEWIESDIETTASAGWATLSNYASVTIDENLDIETYSKLLDRVETSILNQKNRVRYTMNAFVIAVGLYIKELTNKSLMVAENIGRVEVYMNKTSCKVPFAKDYINKVVLMERVGKKRKGARC